MARRPQPLSIIEEFTISFAEEFQALLQMVGNAVERDDSLAILVTASQFAEGATTIALSLGQYLSRVYDPTDVVVVEANLRRPSFQNLFGLKRVDRGLQEALLGTTPIEETIVRSGDSGVYILPSHSSPDDRDLLTVEAHREQLTQLIDTLRAGFRFIIADSPPIIQYLDASSISASFDGVIFVVEANRTRVEVADKALARLDSGGANIVGAVLNKREYHIPNFLYRML